MNPLRLLQVMIIASVLEAAAAITIGSVGVQPGLVPAALFLVYISLQLSLGVRYPGIAVTWPIARPFVFITVWAVISSIILPRLLEGQVYVWPQKSEPPFVLTPLAPSSGNINQDIYLIVNASLVVLGSLFVSSPTTHLRSLFNTYLFSGFIVFGISAWQCASKLAGVPFPDQLFYSNPGWAILTTQQIGSMPRVNGPFAEPSALATYMAAIVCSAGWLLLVGHKAPGLRLLLLLAIATIVLSTSATGFGVLALAGCGVTARSVLRGNRRLMAGIARLGIPLVVVVALAGLVVSVVKPAIWSNLADVIESTVNKQDSSSYQDRTSADIDSLTAFVDSFGLGTGWGSNRSSSLIPGLLASIGLPGMVGLLWFIISLTNEVRQVRPVAPSQELFVIDGCCGALVGYLLAGILSAPTLSSVTFFFLIALLIGSIGRAKIASTLRYRASVTRQAQAAASV
jgi:hypothetical protein